MGGAQWYGGIIVCMARGTVPSCGKVLPLLYNTRAKFYARDASDKDPRVLNTYVYNVYYVYYVHYVLDICFLTKKKPRLETAKCPSNLSCLVGDTVQFGFGHCSKRTA